MHVRTWAREKTDSIAPGSTHKTSRGLTHAISKIFDSKTIAQELDLLKAEDAAEGDLERVMASSGCPIGFGLEAEESFLKSYTNDTTGFTIQTMPHGHNSGRLFAFKYSYVYIFKYLIV
jgi:hypothetical protein